MADDDGDDVASKPQRNAADGAALVILYHLISDDSTYSL